MQVNTRCSESSYFDEAWRKFIRLGEVVSYLFIQDMPVVNVVQHYAKFAWQNVYHGWITETTQFPLLQWPTVFCSKRSPPWTNILITKSWSVDNASHVWQKSQKMANWWSFGFRGKYTYLWGTENPLIYCFPSQA